SYVWETDYFQPHWQEAFWGDNYDRLLAIKTKYDPDGLFVLHHGVGSEDWSADGFTRLKRRPSRTPKDAPPLYARLPALRQDDLQPLRPQRAQAARHIARPLT